jgi:hypothetical protein
MKTIILLLSCTIFSCTDSKKEFKSKLQNDAIDIEAQLMAEVAVSNEKYNLTKEEVKNISPTIIKFEEENYNKGDNYL